MFCFASKALAFVTDPIAWASRRALGRTAEGMHEVIGRLAHRAAGYTSAP